MIKQVTTIITVALSLSITTALEAQYFVNSNLPNPVPVEAAPVLEKTTTISLDQAKSFDFSGHWIGTRYQYTDLHDAIMKEFKYEFDLKQRGTEVFGTTTIEGSNGDYAVMKVKGSVVGNKLYFQEYQVQDEMKDDNMVWCFKVGELYIGNTDGHTLAYGPTNSYTTNYYLPCTGGFTMVQKLNDSDEEVVVSNKTNDKDVTKNDLNLSSAISISAFPNPFATTANVVFSIPESASVQIELMSIDGKTISVIQEPVTLEMGQYSYNINGRGLGLQNGVYIVRATIGESVYSENIVYTNL